MPKGIKHTFAVKCIPELSVICVSDGCYSYSHAICVFSVANVLKPELLQICENARDCIGIELATQGCALWTTSNDKGFKLYDLPMKAIQ